MTEEKQTADLDAILAGEATAKEPVQQQPEPEPQKKPTRYYGPSM